MKYVKWVACAVVLAVFAGAVFNQEVGKGKDKKADKKTEDKKADKKTEDKPATHKVAKKPFKIEVSVSGILASEDAVEIAFLPQPMVRPPEGQSSLTIKQVAAHGTAVKKGDVLVALDTTKMDEVIDNLREDQKSLEANIKVAEAELPLQEQSAPLELAAAETAKKRADEDLKYFLDIGRAQSEKQAQMWVKSAKFSVEYAEEELTQLKKMYKANDLTEETERMILRRAQHYLEQINYWYQMSLLERDYTLKYTLPNKEKALKEDQAKSALALDKARKTWTPWLAQKRASLAKLRHEFENGAERLAKLTKDRAAMTITAPVDGVVYHGRFHQGSWNVSESVDSKLMPGATVQPDKVLMTIVQPRGVLVHVSIDEKEVNLVKADLKGVAKFTALPNRKMPVRVTQVSPLPSAPGKFAAVVRLENPGNDLVPGLACTLKFVPYQAKDAFAVPAKCIYEEDDKDVVYVLLPGGKNEMRTVTVGRSDGKDVEILTGIREGDEVLLERPSAKTAAKEKGATP